MNDGQDTDIKDTDYMAEETISDTKSNSLTEVLSILYVTIVMIALFLKIMFG